MVFILSVDISHYPRFTSHTDIHELGHVINVSWSSGAHSHSITWLHLNICVI